MRSTIISIILFLSLLGFVTYANHSLSILCKDISVSSKKIESLVSKDEWEDAYLTTVELINEIQQTNMLSSVYINHNDFDNLVNEALKLSLYVRGRDETETHVSVHLLRYSAENICKLHKPSIENIF